MKIREIKKYSLKKKSYQSGELSLSFMDSSELFLPSIVCSIQLVITAKNVDLRDLQAWQRGERKMNTPAVVQNECRNKKL